MTLAYSDPSSFAYSLVGTPGYSAHIRGEAAQVFRCTPVPARRRITGDCFMELPVTINNKPMYLQPKTRTITAKGTEITCDPFTTAMYHIKDKWYELTSDAHKTAPTPDILRQNSLPWGHVNDVPATMAEELTKGQESPTTRTLETTLFAKTIMCIAITVVIALTAKCLHYRHYFTVRTQAYARHAHRMHPLISSIDNESPTGPSSHDRIEILHQNTTESRHTPTYVDAEIDELRAAYCALEFRIARMNPAERNRVR